VAEDWIGIQVKPGRKGKEGPDQQAIFIEKVGFVAM
jgi:hypothetical protein